jgi:peptidoglycan L-alanyl-D-glutamate endopeptidase CwlK
MTLAPRSETKLSGVHPDLVKIARRASEIGGRFHITCGMRTLEEQKALVAAGKSKTLKSRHLTGHAIDVVAVTDDGVSYDMDDMTAVSRKMKAAAAELGISIEWGGDWKSFIDTPHYQLPWADYPADAPAVRHPEANKPLGKSGTVWGSLGAVASGAAVYAEQTMSWALDTIAAMTSIEPIKALMLQAGANAQAMALGTLVFCGFVVIGRRARVSDKVSNP